jgi:hypothetical protein
MRDIFDILAIVSPWWIPLEHRVASRLFVAGDDLTMVRDMVCIKKITLISLALFSLSGVFQPAASFVVVSGESTRPRHLAWTSLTFNYTGILTKLTVEMKMQSPAALNDRLLTRLGASLREWETAIKEMRLMTVDLKTEGRFIFNEQYTEKIWFNPFDGRAYCRIRYLKSGDPWVKIYSWTDRGVHRKKIQPADERESRQDPVKWTKLKESFYPYPDSMVHSPNVSDPLFLLNYVPGLISLGPKVHSQILVFGKEQLYRLTCRREKSYPMTVSYKSHTPAGAADIQKTLLPLIFSVTAEPYSYKNKDSEAFSLLGLQEDILIYLDPATYLPIRISGRNAIWGELILDLTDAHLL